MSRSKSMPAKAMLAAVAAIFVWPPAAAAQDTGKKTIGTITAMEAGDVACYLSLRDDSGGRFRELAEFEICEQRSLLNKRVALTYRQGRVIADECQGNPDCKKSRTVMLVASARPIGPAAGSPSTAASAQESHCTAADTVLFSCATGAKLVSVCASKDAGRTTGYLQYRFGTAGEPLEISLPDGRVAPARAATGQAVPFSGGAWLRFSRGAHGYVAYDGIGNWGPRGEKRPIAGLVVEKDGKRVANLKCSARPRSELGPELFERLGIMGAGQDFDFPTDG